MKLIYLQPLLVLFVAATMARAATAKDLPADTCVLEINSRDDVLITVDGVNYGTTKRAFTYRSLKPGVRYLVKLKVRFPGDHADSDEPTEVYIIGGHRIILAVHPDNDRAPEVVLQTGHRDDITAMAVSPDEKLIATGGNDHNVILWNTETQDQIRTIHRLKDQVCGVSFSPDGRHLAAAGSREVAVWEVATGTHVRSIDTSFDDKEVKNGYCTFQSIDFDTTGRHVAIGCGYSDYQSKPPREWGIVLLWNVNTGKRTREFRGPTSEVTAVCISPDGKQVAAGTETGALYIWDVESAALISSTQLHKEDVTSLAFSPDSRNLASAAEDEGIAILNIARRQVLYQTKVDWSPASVEWNTDGTEVISGAGAIVVRVDVQNKSATKIAHQLGSNSYVDTIVRYLPRQKQIAVVADDRMAIFDHALDGPGREFVHHPSLEIRNFVTVRARSQLVAQYGEHLAMAWDIGNGQLGRRVKIDGEMIAVSPEGEFVAYKDVDKKVSVWSLTANQRLRQYEIDAERVESAVFGPQAAILAIEEEDAVVRTWSTSTGKMIATIRHPDDRMQDMVFSPDGQMIATTAGTKMFFSDPLSGRSIQQVEVKKGFVNNDGKTVDVAVHVGKFLAFHPSGRRIFVASDIGLMEYEVGTGRRIYQNAQFGFYRAAYSPEGDVVLAGSGEGGLLMRYSAAAVKTGRYTHDSNITAVAVDPVANLDISASSDGTIGLWDTATGNFVGRLMLFDEGKDWAIVGQGGLFDGSPGGRKLIRFRLGNELRVVPAERFFQDFYYPGLLAAYFRGERPFPAHTLGDKLAPLVKIVEPVESTELTVNSPTVRIRARVSDQGGGLKAPWIVHNGAKLLAPSTEVSSGKVVERNFTVTLVEGANRIEVHSASEDGSWESEPARLTVNFSQQIADARLYAICIGISNYAAESMNLRFAAQDAQSFGQLFRTRSTMLFAKDRVHVSELTNELGTKQQIAKTFSEIAASAKPQDTVVVFLAGHGAMVGQRYYFIPHEFKPVKKDLDDDIREQGLPGDELDEFINAIPALKRLVIYDTCQSGGAINLGYRSRNAFAFRGAMERMSRATGSFTIAATSATEDAKEVDELGHGVLSYALLAGAGSIEAGPLKSQRLKADDKVVEVREWFNYAQDKVPLLTKLFLGQEQFVSSSGSGTSFPILPLDE